VEFGRHVKDFMTTNIAIFVTPNPALTTLTTATDDMETAFNNAADGGKLLTALLHDKEVIFDQVMTALGNYVDNIAQGSETVIKSAGMETKRISSPISVIVQVTGLSAKPGKLTGEVALSWIAVYGHRVYLVYAKA